MKARHDDGFVLIVALWMLAGLAAFASAFAIYSVRTAESAALPEERLRAEAALRAGIELSMARQLSWPKPARPDFGAFTAYIGTARVEAVYRSESARVDLNAAPREMIARLFAGLGASEASAGFLADRVLAWRGRLDDTARKRETAIYAKAGLAYTPPGAPFDNALEIALLPGMTPALARRALGYVTIYGGAKVDPYVADEAVLAALPGANAAVVKDLIAARAGERPTSAALARLAGAAKDFVSADPNENIRVEVTTFFGDRRIHAEAVLKIKESGPTPYEVLYWRDDFDG